MEMAFTGSIMKVGNSLSLVLPKPVCDNFQIEKGGSLKIITTETGLFIPVQPRESAYIQKELQNALKSWSGKGDKAQSKNNNENSSVNKDNKFEEDL
jgi:antitoxin component of MazEF toxin-antitoxin module